MLEAVIDEMATWNQILGLGRRKSVWESKCERGLLVRTEAFALVQIATVLGSLGKWEHVMVVWEGNPFVCWQIHTFYVRVWVCVLLFFHQISHQSKSVALVIAQILKKYQTKIHNLFKNNWFNFQCTFELLKHVLDDTQCYLDYIFGMFCGNAQCKYLGGVAML